MSEPATITAPADPHHNAPESYGLHAGVLGPVETLAQSVSAVAPSTSPSLTIPLVFALAGNATWFVYLLATSAILLVGFCVSRFARISASPGSLYTYVANTLPPICGVTVAWGLLLAYIATGASVAGGAVYYSTMITQQFFHWAPPAIPMHLRWCAAFRVRGLPRRQTVGRTHVVDRDRLGELDPHRPRSPSSIDLGLQLDRDQFIGSRESTCPRSDRHWCWPSSASWVSRAPPLWELKLAIHCAPSPGPLLQCALHGRRILHALRVFRGLGFRGQSGNLSETTSPLHILAGRAGISPLGVGIDLGALISVFACVLACTTASARVLMRMAHARLLPQIFERTSARHRTPTAAVALSGGLMFIGHRGAVAARRQRVPRCTTYSDRFPSSDFSPHTRLSQWRCPLPALPAASTRTPFWLSAHSPW